MRRLALCLLFGLLAQPLLADCGEGCLSCAVDADNNFSCLVCDSQSDYFREVGTSTCKKMALDNCEVPSPEYLCHRCLPGYILDQVGGKCLKVPPTSSVVNCHRYSSSGVCIECDTGYYMNLGKCEPITTAVHECLRYSTPTHCSSCNDGFYLITKTTVAGSGSVTTTECVAVTLKDNCQAYSIAQCDTCKSGKIINRNFMNSSTFSLTFLQSVFMKNSATFQLEPKEGPLCVSPADTFCGQIQSSTGKCVKCLDGYYRDDQGLCIKNPEDAVAHCLKYNAPNDCMECLNLYYLQSSECKLHTPVDNCSKYSKSTDECVECDTEHFLQSNLCQNRTKIIIPQCKNLKIDADVCEVCMDGYYTYSDVLGCQKMIPNCQTEAENTVDPLLPRFTCTTCNTDHYPSTDSLTCLKQHVANCNGYTVNTNTCSGCDAGFYYVSGSNTCLSEYVPNCTTPNTTIRGQCTTCRTGFYKDGSEVCHPYTVTNCVSKSASADECTSCDLGPGNTKIYYFNNTDKRCRPYTLSGCTTPNDNENICDTCDAGNGYVKDPDGHCRKNPSPGCSTYNWTTKLCTACTSQGTDFYLDAVTNTCQQYSIEGCSGYSTTTNKCDTNACATNYYYDSTSSLCFKYDLVGCTIAGRHATKNECTSSGCEPGYYFDSGSNLCNRYSINVSNCTTPMTTQDGCTTCKTDFYKDADTNNCFWLSLPGCSQVNASNPSQCTTCDNDFITAANSVCLPKTAMNCDSSSTSLDECTSCSYSSGYALDSDTKSCIKTDVIGCKTFSSSDGTCTACMDGLGFNGTSCQVPSKHHCISYDTSNGNCTQCTMGFFLDTGDCFENTAADCLIKKTDDNKCEICKKGFYSSTGDCTAVTEANCYKTSLTADACLSCLPGFKFATGTCSNPIDYKDNEIGCLYNDVINTACSQCQNGFFRYKKKFVTHRVENCVKYVTDSCTQCAPSYALTGAGKCVAQDTAAALCIQSIENETMDLLLNTSCAVCKNTSTHWVDSGSSDACTAFTTANETPLCGQFSTSADECLGCTSEHPPLTEFEVSVCLKKNFASAPTLTNVTNCASIKYSTYLGGTYHCKACQAGFYFDTSTPPKCVPATDPQHHIGIGLNNSLFINTLALNTDPSTSNCTKYMTTRDGTVLCVECRKGTMGRLDATDVADLIGKTNNNFWDPYNKEILFKANGINFKSCAVPSTVTDFPDNSAILPTSPDPFRNCENYLVIDSNTADSNAETSYCIKCKSGFVGTVLNTLKDSGGTNMSDPTMTVFLHCETPTTDLIKKYSLFTPGSANPIAANNLNHNILLQYDACTEGRHMLAAFLRGSNMVGLGFVRMSGSPVPNMMCMDELSPTNIANCQIHRLPPPAGVATDVDPSADAWQCDACKPGFKMGGNRHDGTATCTRIENCDLSDPTKNTWMSNCQTCQKGYSWKYDGTDFTSYHICVSNFGDENCVIFDLANSKCKVCRENFDIVSNKCVPQNVDENCLEYSQTLDYHGNTSADTHYSFIAGLFLKRYENKPAVRGCARCKPGYDNVYVNFDEKTCARTAWNLNLIPNCEMFNIKDMPADEMYALTCMKCKKGYALTTVKRNCTQIDQTTAKRGASGLDASGDPISCHEGFVFHSTIKVCYDEADLDMDMTMASILQIVFKRGLRPLNWENGAFKLVPIEEDNPCIQYHQGTCISCKDEKKMPFKLAGFLAEGIPLVECVSFSGAQDLYPAILEKSGSDYQLSSDMSYFGDFIFSKPNAIDDFQCSPYNFSDPTCLLQSSHMICDKCIEGYYLTDRDTSIGCKPIPVTNCAEYDLSISKCTRCVGGYYLDGSFVCQKRTELDCIEFSEHFDSCVVCKKGFYVGINGGGDPECVRYTKKNCAEYYSQGDFCYTCLDGYYFDTTDEDCKYFQQPECTTIAKTKNRCLLCKNGYYLNSDGVCKQTTISNCRTANKYSNTCLICEEGSYLDELSLCQFHSASNCKTYKPYENECSECFPNAFLKDGWCKQYTAINCRRFNPVADACLTCADSSFFADAGGSCRSYSVKNCKQVSRSSNSCLSCVAGTFKHKTGCKQYTVENCYIFNKYSDGCAQCLDNFYLNDDMRCLAYTVKNCRVFFRHTDRCKICNDGHFNDLSFKCHPYDINRCARFHSNENKCLACQPGFYLENAKCLAYSVQNCKEFHPFENECLSCNTRFYFDESGSCLSYNLHNCDLLDPVRNRCLKCSDKFYMKPDFSCEPYLVTCLTYNVYADECLSCIKDHHLVRGHSCKENDIPNCEEYVANQNQCSICEKGYLLKDGICNKYTARNCLTFKTDANKCDTCLLDFFYLSSESCLESTKVVNCLKYKSDEDVCVECVLGFYLFGGVCKKNPEGIPKCTHYNDPKTCRRCVSGMYLEENVCILSAALVSNCQNYIGEAKCGECQTGHLLDFNNTCTAPTNVTCLTYVDLENCKTCGSNKVLKKNADGKTECALSGIADCDLATATDTATTCIKCLENHILADNKCSVPVTPLEGCRHYKSTTECLECSEGYLLAFDQKSCVGDSTQLDASCLNGHLNTSPQCFLCLPGFKFDLEGNCVLCSAEGCDLCAVTGDTCRLCNKGYYMNKEMQCVKYAQTSLRVIEDDGTFTTETMLNSASRLNFSLLFALLSALSLFSRN